jgi:1-acyl-sn-glycerol-3-phosphate acyltransferase
MSLTTTLVNRSVKGITRILCKVDDQQVARIPAQGPLILVTNHINFLEVPLVYTHLLPRSVTGFAKSETWDNPALRPLFNLWQAIPLHRGEADLQAMRAALKVLQNGSLLAITPEGTRSGDGRLKRGHPGVVMVAQMSNAPLLPLVYYGGEQFYHNIRRLQRTDFHIVVGRPLRLKIAGIKLSRAVRQQITDEIMYQLAALLPPLYRGVYADLDNATQEYLEFLPEQQHLQYT